MLAEVAVLLAFCRATRERVPTTSSAHFTQVMATWLKCQGVIDLSPHSASRAGIVHRAIYDPISWRFVWPAANEPDFEQEVARRIRAIAAQSSSVPQKVQMWRILASAEVEGYLSNQLGRHGFDTNWWVDVIDRANDGFPGSSRSRRCATSSGPAFGRERRRS